MASNCAGVNPFSSSPVGSGRSAQYMAVRSMVDCAADVRRTSTSSVYSTPGVPRRSSRPLGIDSTRQALAGVGAAVGVYSGMSVAPGKLGCLDRPPLVLRLVSGEHGHE